MLHYRASEGGFKRQNDTIVFGRVETRTISEKYMGRCVGRKRTRQMERSVVGWLECCVSSFIVSK